MRFDSVFGARFPPLSGVFFILACLAACTAPQTRALRDTAPSEPRQVELTQTPFFPQSDFQCGPAALATALRAAGIAVDPDSVAPQVFLPERKGSLQLEMIAAARRNGALPVPLAPELRALLVEMGAGRPVIVLQNLSLSWAPIWHYAVAIGYDLDASEIILRSGRTRRLTMSMSTFERTWARGGYWAIAVAAPGSVPASVSEPSYLQAALAFEKVAPPDQSLLAYQAATRRWPASELAWMGTGNSAFRLKQWQVAESAFRRAAESGKDPVPALNNLALTLEATGRIDEAIEIARRATAAGGPFETTARETLAELLARSAHTATTEKQ